MAPNDLRNRDVLLPTDTGELAEPPEDLSRSLGLGFCWHNESRGCDETCAAYNAHANPGEHPCLVLSAIQDIVAPVTKPREELLDELKAIRKSMDEATRGLLNLGSAIQMASARVR